nr:cytochrome oxidase putative small subunit CydP [uncultured Duganella sp.]
MNLRRRYGTPLALAITLALVVKALILYGLWYAFFSAPQAKHMRMPTATVEQHLMAPAAPPTNTPQRK